MRWLTSGLVAAMLALGACSPDPLFMSCPFSASIHASCAASGDSTVFTCVVEEHPYCLESICASWQGAEAVCTKACTADAGCPSGSRCQTHLSSSFCVQESHLNAVVYDLPDADERTSEVEESTD